MFNFELVSKPSSDKNISYPTPSFFRFLPRVYHNMKQAPVVWTLVCTGRAKWASGMLREQNPSCVSAFILRRNDRSRLKSSWSGKFMLGNWTTAMLTPHTHPYTVHGRFKLKDDCERFWDGPAPSVNSKRNVRLVMKWANFMNHLWA